MPSQNGKIANKKTFRGKFSVEGFLKGCPRKSKKDKDGVGFKFQRITKSEKRGLSGTAE